VFNRSYTQYIPLSIYDLQSWMGSPSIYVYDCNNAGIIVESFKNFAEQHEREYLDLLRQGAATGGLAGAEVLTNCLKTIRSPSTRLEFVPTAQSNYSD
jgi:regulator-associated protein of mTOR